MGSPTLDPAGRLEIADRANEIADTPAAEPAEPPTWATQLGEFSAILDRVTDTDGPRHLARIRIGKAAEEFGEVEAALIAWEGSNPRKPDGPVDQVLKELLDVATAALGAYEHLTGNVGASGAALEEHCRFLLTRMQDATR